MKKRSLQLIVTVLLCWLIIIGIRYGGLIEQIELLVYDRTTEFVNQPSGTGDRILIIEITEEDIQKSGAYPISDAQLADALQQLIRSGPLAIGIDIFRDMSVQPGHKQFTSILKKNPNIFCVTKFGDPRILPPAVLHNTDQVGFNDVLVDPAGIVRRGLLFLDDGKKIFTSLSLRLALSYLKTRGIVPQPDSYDHEIMKLGETSIRPFHQNDGGYVGADDRGYQYLINFKDWGTGSTIHSFSELMTDQVALKDIKGRIVLVGVSAQSLKDFFYTPLSYRALEKQEISGVELHAYLTSQLIKFGLGESGPIITMSEPYELIWILLWSFFGGFLGGYIAFSWRLFFIGAGGILFFGIMILEAAVNDIWIPSVPAALAFVLSAASIGILNLKQERSERAALMQIFAKHVSAEVADAIWKKRDQILYKGRPQPQKMTATVMFADLIGFTAISEKLPSGVLLDWLNAYMDRMTTLILAWGGIVDDYAGDGIKADFGVPVAREEEKQIAQDAVKAVNCAIAMKYEMDRLNMEWQKKDLPQAGIRIGINTGEVVAGSLGSHDRMKYTTVGDTVNIAARLEGYQMRSQVSCLDWRLLIGEKTKEMIGENFSVQMIGEIHLKGRNEKVVAYQVLSAVEPVSASYKGR